MVYIADLTDGLLFMAVFCHSVNYFRVTLADGKHDNPLRSLNFFLVLFNVVHAREVR